MTAILLQGVSKRFTLHHQSIRSFQEAFVNTVLRRNGSKEEFWALKDISFKVSRGESFGIIGRNGSGKSTILKLITRILEPTAGSIAVNGKVSALIELGAGFHPDLTGRENIYLNGSILGIGRKQMNQKFDDIVAFSELERFLDTPVRHYSSGMYARLGFAVAVSVEPSVLIVDEVLAVGDESFQRKCLDKISDFKTKGVSILFVSHSLDAVHMMCDRALWLDRGQIRLLGRASEVVDRYLAEAHAGERSWQGGTVSTCQRLSTESKRWGSGEVQVTGVELMDKTGGNTSRFVSGEPLIARLHYHASAMVPRPQFAIGVYSGDGMEVVAPSASMGNGDVPAVTGDGYVDCVVDALPLVSGSYELSVAVYDAAGRDAYDHQHRMYAFDVASASAAGGIGLVHLPCTWVAGGLLVAKQRRGVAPPHRTPALK